MPLKLYPKMRKSVANMGIATKSYVLGTDVRWNTKLNDGI